MLLSPTELPGRGLRCIAFITKTFLWNWSSLLWTVQGFPVSSVQFSVMDMTLPHWAPSECHKSERNMTLRNKASDERAPLPNGSLSSLSDVPEVTRVLGEGLPPHRVFSAFPMGSHSGRRTTCQKLSKPILRGELLALLLWSSSRRHACSFYTSVFG